MVYRQFASITNKWLWNNLEMYATFVYSNILRSIKWRNLYFSVYYLSNCQWFLATYLLLFIVYLTVKQQQKFKTITKIHYFLAFPIHNSISVVLQSKTFTGLDEIIITVSKGLVKLRYQSFEIKISIYSVS